jgi:catalase
MADADGVAGTRGAGGETHQTVDGEAAMLTTQQGIPVADDQNTLTVGERGPSVLEDFHFREKIFHFDHERIPERVVHARGYGAHGYFEAYESLAEITRADPFKEAGRRTPAFVRFSTVAGNKGSSSDDAGVGMRQRPSVRRTDRPGVRTARVAPSSAGGGRCRSLRRTPAA